MAVFDATEAVKAAILRRVLPNISPRRWTRWFVGIAVGVVASALGYVVSIGLGCSTTCSMGRSPLSLALLVGVTAALAAASGMRR
jgi:uncharacterized membrane protein YjjP (DUF1212 family)